jgi:hypothetical protein
MTLGLKNVFITVALILSFLLGCGFNESDTVSQSDPLGRAQLQALRPQSNNNGPRATGICIALFQDQIESNPAFFDWIKPELTRILQHDLVDRAKIQPFLAGMSALEYCDDSQTSPNLGAKLFFNVGNQWPRPSNEQHVSNASGMSAINCSAFAKSDLVRLLVPTNCVEAGKAAPQAAAYVNVERFLSIQAAGLEQKKAQILATALHEILHMYGLLDEIYHSNNTHAHGSGVCDMGRYPQQQNRLSHGPMDGSAGVVVTEYDQESIMNYCFLDSLAKPSDVRLSDGDVELLMSLYGGADGAE